MQRKRRHNGPAVACVAQLHQRGPPLLLVTILSTSVHDPAPMMMPRLQPTAAGWTDHLRSTLARRDTGLLDALALVSEALGRCWRKKRGRLSSSCRSPPHSTLLPLACTLLSGCRLCRPGALVGSPQHGRCVHPALPGGGARSNGGVAAARPLQLGAVARAACSAAPLLRCRRTCRLGRHSAVAGPAPTLQRPLPGCSHLPSDAGVHVV